MKKRSVGVIFICSSVSKLFDSIILGDQKIMFFMVCMCVPSSFRNTFMSNKTILLANLSFY